VWPESPKDFSTADRLRFGENGNPHFKAVHTCPMIAWEP